MNTTQATMLSITMAMGSLMCAAQDATVPIRQLAHDAQLSASMTPPDGEAAVSRSNAILYTTSSVSGISFAPPAPVRPQSLGRAFYLLNGVHLGMAALDVGMTQHCIADQHCKEGNPLMPSSLGGQVGVDFALVASGVFASARLKKHGSKLWWLSTTVGISAHGVGVASGIANR